MNFYPVKKFPGDTLRYVRHMSLRPDAQLIAEYRKRHSKDFIWHEIIDGLKEVGVLEMEIYIDGTDLVMIVEVPADLNWDAAMARLATMPRQQEWEDYMSEFQNAEKGATATDKWKPMTRMFYFYE